MDASGLAAITVTVEDKTSKGTLTPKELFNAVWAVNYQVSYHFNRSTWIEGGFATPAHVVLLPSGMKPPVGAYHVILLDDADQAGALGWHDDEAGGKIPYSEVFVKTSRSDGADPAEVLSHEVIEMLCDPFVDPTSPRKTINPRDNYYYIIEACDAVQGCGYDVGAPEGRKCGVTVADFCTPAWWTMDSAHSEGPFSFRNSVDKPFKLAPQGYISKAPATDQNAWEQVFGAERESRPTWASRLPRVHNA